MSVASRKLWLYLELFAAGLLAALLALRVVLRYLLPTAQKSLEGKVVVVTNCSHPLVATLATELSVRHRCLVACVDNSAACADALAADIRSLGGDPSTSSFVWSKEAFNANQLCAQITQKYERVDFLIIGEGLIQNSSHGTESAAATIDSINKDLMSHFSLALAFLPLMLSRDSGHLVTLSAYPIQEPEAGRIARRPDGEQLAEALLRELRRTNCQVRLTRVRAVAEQTVGKTKWKHFTRADVAADIISGIRKNKQYLQSPGLGLLIKNYISTGLRTGA